MSEHIPGALARAVRDRAGNICEYCHLPQLLQEAAFHIDHISPRSGKGPSHADNLALACVTCSLKKAARTRARDASSKELVPLFHPRFDRWRDHFRWSGSKLMVWTWVRKLGSYNRSWASRSKIRDRLH